MDDPRLVAYSYLTTLVVSIPHRGPLVTLILELDTLLSLSKHAMSSSAHLGHGVWLMSHMGGQVNHLLSVVWKAGAKLFLVLTARVAPSTAWDARRNCDMVGNP